MLCLSAFGLLIACMHNHIFSSDISYFLHDLVSLRYIYNLILLARTSYLRYLRVLALLALLALLLILALLAQVAQVAQVEFDLKLEAVSHEPPAIVIQQ